MSGGLPLRSAVAHEAASPLRGGRLVLAVDLETLVTGGRDETARLAERLRQRVDTAIVYAAPTRTLHSTRVCMEAFRLPDADVVVTDAGASIHAVTPHAELHGLDASVGERWPGVHQIRRRVQSLGHLLIEHRWDEARRMTYFPRPDVSREEARVAIDEVLSDLEVDVRATGGGQIDVLPQGTDLTTTVMRTLDALNTDPSRAVVAGGFVEPQFFDDGGYWGIATGDTPEPIRASLAQYSRVHITSAQGARGVLDGLQALGFL